MKLFATHLTMWKLSENLCLSSWTRQQQTYLRSVALCISKQQCTTIYEYLRTETMILKKRSAYLKSILNAILSDVCVGLSSASDDSCVVF